MTSINGVLIISVGYREAIVIIEIGVAERNSSRSLKVSIRSLEYREIAHVQLQWLLLENAIGCRRIFSLPHRDVMKLIALVALVVQEILVIHRRCFQIYLELCVA